MHIRSFQVSAYETNCYLVSKGTEAIVIDPGDDCPALVETIAKEQLHVTHIIITHTHLDHFYGAMRLSQSTGAKIYIHPDDEVLIDQEISTWKECMYSESCGPIDHEPLPCGTYHFLEEKCEVMLTPGHTPGSVTLYFPELSLVFVGDVIFQRSVGRHDLPGGDYQTLMASIHNVILPLPDSTTLYTGHGPTTTVGSEKQFNPFIR
ncbi:MBL fold metallo-hydrolase [Pseudodesulfovibrio sp. JC047]|uniref:MBL fold metallo-hydrolase n=1 Tax=Pseudodesulfovibrio sp. JC047 TaxID=2683199 RepID=UPI0013D676C8|nr:MBL fold metallo-hydrolase [Pseudodesulfovibrio sp. JC047]NDV18800.1 MBL fold metallo-hydrolase [Pseudodesulfovibrio sp. JC047]